MIRIGKWFYKLQREAFTIGGGRPWFLVIVCEGFDQVVFAIDYFDSFAIIAKIAPILSCDSMGPDTWIT